MQPAWGMHTCMSTAGMQKGPAGRQLGMRVALRCLCDRMVTCLVELWAARRGVAAV
jgi:hypothetical protein